MPKLEEVPKKQNLFCQNLRRYQKDQKTKVPKVLGPGDLQNFGFLVPPRFLARFSRKILPEPEEVPKKPKSRGENLAKT